MAKRWQVTRGGIFHKHTYYPVGEYMPEDFTEKDRARNVYGRRLIQVEVPDEPLAVSEGTDVIVPPVDPPAVPDTTVVDPPVVTENDPPATSEDETVKSTETETPAVITETVETPETTPEVTPETTPKETVTPVVVPETVIDKAVEPVTPVVKTPGTTAPKVIVTTVKK